MIFSDINSHSLNLKYLKLEFRQLMVVEKLLKIYYQPVLNIN
jgi:hypothetical protein